MKQWWNLDDRLLDLNGRDSVRLRHILENCLNVGSIGSGKTSGVLQHLLRACFAHGFGALLLCVKQDSGSMFKRWAEAEGRGQDIVEFSMNAGLGFNFLNDACAQNGKRFVVHDVAHILMTALEIINPSATREKAFFSMAARDLAMHNATTLFAAEGHLSIEPYAELISSFPRRSDELRVGRTVFARTLEKALIATTGKPEHADVLAVRRFAEVDWPAYATETRESIRATLQVLMSELTREPLLSLFGKKSDVTPQHILDGKIVILDIPVQSWERIGPVAAALFKTALQRAVLSRNAHQASDPAAVRPILIAADEAQAVVTPGDEQYISSSRSLRGVTVYATQSLPSMEMVLGESATNTLLASFRNRFICRTEDPKTAAWVRDTTGQLINAGLPTSAEQLTSSDASTDMLRQLKQGKDGLVEAVVILGNEVFKSVGRRFYKATFPQAIEPPQSWGKQLWRKYTTNYVRILRNG